MSSDLTLQVMGMNSSKLQNSMQVALFKKTHDMQTDLLETLMQTTLSAPPPGQGKKVDKLA